MTVTESEISENKKIKTKSIMCENNKVKNIFSTPSNKSKKSYMCKHCYYNTSRKFNFDKHMLSKKHKKRANLPQKVAKNDPKKEAEK